jgi:type III pantothenate kinase
VRFLLLNINNTYTKFAAATPSTLGSMRRITTDKVTRAWLLRLRRKYAGHRVILASVVPARTRLAKAVFGRDAFIVSGLKDLGIGIDFPRKKQIGADRLANAVAARALYGSPVVVVDFGTALTFDVVNRRGLYCGGAIAPGLNAMTEYLYQRTALLPRLQLKEPSRAVGRSTREAMLVGAITGYRGLVRGILQAIREELGVKFKVVATGGQAKLMARGLKEIDIVNPLLTMDGLRMIAVHRYMDRS